MGAYDEFFDLERNRTSQSYAFGLNYNTYYHEIDCDDIVPNEVGYRTYYVQTSTPCYFIRIEGNRFTGIVSVLEDEIKSYPTFDYGGKFLDLSARYYNTLMEMAEAYAVIEENAYHLPMKQIRNKYSSFRYHVSGKISHFPVPNF